MAGRFANLRGTLELAFKIAIGQIDASALTAARAYALPDKSGTFALLDDITGGGMRKRTVFLTASDAAVEVPTWARDGSGVVYVTGSGGGGSGGYDTGTNGSSGAAAGSARRYPMPIPSGTTSVAVVVGAGGAARSTPGAGNAGGDSSVTVGGATLVMEGGSGGPVTSVNTAGGVAFIRTTGASIPPSSAQITALQGLSLLAQGGTGQSSAARGGTGGFTPFGRGTLRVTSGASLPAEGYGSGSGGCSRGGTGTGAGAPGFNLLEFEEGASA